MIRFGHTGKYGTRKAIYTLWAFCACTVLLTSSLAASLAAAPDGVLPFVFGINPSKVQSEKKSDGVPEKIGKAEMDLAWSELSMPQDFGIYLEERALTCESLLKDGVRYVGLADIIGVFAPCAEVHEEGGKVTAVGEEIEISAAQSDFWIAVGGRCIPCNFETGENGALMIDCGAVSKIFLSDSKVSKDGGNVVFSCSRGICESDGSFYGEDELYWLSRIICAESRGESIKGKIAVGNVVLNRTETDGFPNTVKDVIFDSSCGVQFAPTADGSVYCVPDYESVTAAKLCLEGYSVSDSILYFFNPDTACDSWIEENRTFVTVIGNHEFYS